MDVLGDFVVDDALAHEPLGSLGWEVSEVPWRQPADWDRFDAVVVRSTWDYVESPRAFLSVLEQVEASRAVLLNPLDLIRWNLAKTYLRDLAGRGVDTVPTIWGRGRPDLDALVHRLGSDRLVLKPEVGANAVHTFVVSQSEPGPSPAELAVAFAHRPWMAQPFVDSVVSEGEFSLFFFDGAYSHCVLKTPAPGDFRVQEEHGAAIESVDPEPRLLRAATRAVAVLPAQPLYARVDLVRHGAGFHVMELELVEPSLYLRMDPRAPTRFARAFHEWMARGGPSATR